MPKITKNSRRRVGREHRKPTDNRRRDGERAVMSRAEIKKILKRKTVTIVAVHRTKGRLHYNLIVGKTPRTFRVEV